MEKFKITTKQIRDFVKNNKCPKCSSTTNITKSGKRYNVGNDIQIFRCRNGRHFFSIDLDQLRDYEEAIR
jgi:transposase-like protein